jgi:hypothetical protein
MLVNKWIIEAFEVTARVCTDCGADFLGIKFRCESCSEEREELFREEARNGNI